MIRLIVYSLLALSVYLGYRWHLGFVETGTLIMLSALAGGIYTEVWK
jgi:hypothetical protein